VAGGASVDAFARVRLRAFLDSRRDLVLPAARGADVLIVMAVHQQAHLTYLALETLVAVTAGHGVELVLVDDGSTDETWELLGRVRNARIRRNLRSEGLGAARTRGARMAGGRYERARPV
jgi:GT2 family glycosyltransferase